MWRIPKAHQSVKDESTKRKFLMAEQERLTHKFRNSFSKSQVETSPCFSTYLPPKIHQYNRLTLNQLKAAPNIMHIGKICVCRTVSPSIKTLSLLTIVEFPDVDPENEAVFLTVFNNQLPEGANHESSIPVFATGTILAVFNPMFFQACANEIYTVRCNNPADVSVLSQSEFQRLFPRLDWRSGEIMNEDLSIFTKSWPHPFGDWMSVGNYWFEKKNYVGAIQAYSLAAELGNYIAALILRCSSYLKLKLYKKSLEDSDNILDIIPFHKKAVCYRASSLMGLSRYEGAIVFLEFLIGRCKSPADSQQKEELVELLLKAKTWMKQERNGHYDIIQIIDCSMRYCHDCADYTGSVVEQNIQDKGRGMIATEDIKCGDLILGAKALAVVIHKSKENIPVVPINMDTKDCISSSEVRLNVAIAYRLIQDPDIAETIFCLHDGPREPSDLNDNKHSNKSINLRRISSICHFNSFSQQFREGRETKCVSGVWPSASLFNHGGFDSNAAWQIFGNFLIVRASRDIKKDEEITIIYFPVTCDYPDRLNILSHYDFVCICTLCTIDSKDSIVTHNYWKEKLWRSGFSSNTGVSACEFAKLIEEIEQQRSDNPELNVWTVYPKLRLADFYKRKKEYLKASQLLKNTYQYTCKTVLTTVSLKCCYNGIFCALESGDFENAKLWVSDMKNSLIQSYGMSSQALLNCVAQHVAELMAEYGMGL